MPSPNSSTSTVYRHTQIGWTALAILAVVAVIVLGASAHSVGPRGLSWSAWEVWIGPAILAVTGVASCSQTVEVDHETLRWYFGPGIWRNEIDLSDIKSVQPFTYSRMTGYGIRWTSRGWLYNVSGTEAVEIHTTESTFAIGTDEPERLRSALEERARLNE